VSARAPVAKPSRRRASRFGSFAPLVLIVVGSLAVSALATLRPGDHRRLSAIFPPWWSAAQSLSAASEAGPVTGLGAFSFIVAVRGDGADLEDRLRAAGALLVIDGSKFPFCGTSDQGA
jgi:hypothetical protein